MNALAIYIHWPFCVSKCPYCDFNSRPLNGALDEKLWQNAYIRELERERQSTGPRNVTSIYFGGGTPSLMRAETVACVLDSIARLWTLDPACEVTIEANPSSSETGKFKEFQGAGINRLSLGVQALDDPTLRFLGRAHDVAAARAAITAAATVFPRWSFDLIYAYAGQTAADWDRTLTEALAFQPTHLSLYQLTIEEGTAFFKKARTQTLQVDEDQASDLYERTQERLEKAGLPAYEISNHARAGQESRHNLAYWHYDDYIGIGPGAHGRVVLADGMRRASENTASPQKWMEEMAQNGQSRASEVLLTGAEARKEALMMGLRLKAGLSADRWRALFGEELGACLPSEKVQRLVKNGLFELDGEGALSTPQGREKLNAVLAYLWD